MVCKKYIEMGWNLSKEMLSLQEKSVSPSFLYSTFRLGIQLLLIFQKRENGGDGSNWKAILNNEHFENHVLESCYSLT